MLKIGFIICMILLASCSKEEAQVKEVIRPVRTVEVIRAGAVKNRSFSGVAKSGVESRISFRVNGVLETLFINSGDRVKKGQRLAKVDDSDSKIGFQQAKANERNAKAQKETAFSNLNRVKQLYEKNNISLSNYEQAKNNYAAMNSSYKSAKSNLDLKLKELSYFTLYAPASGVIGSVNFEKNETVQAGSPIMTLNSGGDMEIQVGLPESYISLLKKGSKAEVSFSNLENKVFDAQIDEVSFNIDSRTSTFPVVVKLDHATAEIRPGMTAKVSFAIQSKNESAYLVIPSHVVSDDKGGNFVYVTEASDKDYVVIRKKYIQVGNITNEGFEVSSGLAEGQQVVSAGIEDMREGLKVRLLKR